MKPLLQAHWLLTSLLGLSLIVGCGDKASHREHIRRNKVGEKSNPPSGRHVLPIADEMFAAAFDECPNLMNTVTILESKHAKNMNTVYISDAGLTTERPSTTRFNLREVRGDEVKSANSILGAGVQPFLKILRGEELKVSPVGPLLAIEQQIECYEVRFKNSSERFHVTQKDRRSVTLESGSQIREYYLDDKALRITVAERLKTRLTCSSQAASDAFFKTTFVIAYDGGNRTPVEITSDLARSLSVLMQNAGLNAKGLIEARASHSKNIPQAKVPLEIPTYLDIASAFEGRKLRELACPSSP